VKKPPEQTFTVQKQGFLKYLKQIINKKYRFSAQDKEEDGFVTINKFSKKKDGFYIQRKKNYEEFEKDFLKKKEKENYKTFTAKFDYTSENETELSFKENDKLKIIKMEGEW
jgi:hypothetical protein